MHCEVGYVLQNMRQKRLTYCARKSFLSANVGQLIIFLYVRTALSYNNWLSGYLFIYFPTYIKDSESMRTRPTAYLV